MIWFHIGADGQAAGPRQLAKRMLQERDDLAFLVTSASGEPLPEDVPGMQVHRIPADTRPEVRRFIADWRPDVAVWTEPDFRPSLIAEAHDAGVPMFFVDGQTAPPPPAPRRWGRLLRGSQLRHFRRILTGNDRMAEALIRLGAAPDVLEKVGFLHEGPPALPCNEAERSDLAAVLGTRPVWLAARVGPAEFRPVVTAHRQAMRRAHRLVLILVPEDPAVGAIWADELKREGFAVALRSAGQEPEPNTEIYVADTTDEMGLWYRLAPITFMGQTLAPGNAVSPLEPAALGSAIIHGPNAGRHGDALARLMRAGAVDQIDAAGALGAAVERLLSPATAAELARRAWEVCSDGAEVTDRVMDLILAEIEGA